MSNVNEEVTTYKCIDVVGFRDANHANYKIILNFSTSGCVKGYLDSEGDLCLSGYAFISMLELSKYFELVEVEEEPTPNRKSDSTAGYVSLYGTQTSVEEDKYNLKGLFEKNNVVLSEGLKADLEKQIGIISKVECMNLCRTSD